MNLRILKKKSKQAAALLHYFGVSDDEIFHAEKGNAGIGIVINARKHWARMRCIHGDVIGDGYKYVPRHGNGWVWVGPPTEARKGTVMVGRKIGGEEPEWDERSALEELMEAVFWRGRPAGMTDHDWHRALRITGTDPLASFAEFYGKFDRVPETSGMARLVCDGAGCASAEMDRRG